MLCRMNQSIFKIIERVISIFCISQKQSSRGVLRKVVLKNFLKLSRKHPCQCFFINEVARLRPANLLIKRHWHRYFAVYFAKFLRKPFYIEHSGAAPIVFRKRFWKMLSTQSLY